MTEPLITVSALNAGYVNSHIVFDVDFAARPKEITVIVGPNGSGKSTLLKSIFGLCTVYSGQITFSGKKITGWPPHKVAQNIAYLPQTNNVFSNLNVIENLIMASYTLKEDRISQTMETFDMLKPLKNNSASTLSGGQRQMLGMAMALIRMPQVMLFDEPTASLSPKLADEVLRKIMQMRDEFGITVILVEQNARRALKISDHAYLLANGKNVFDGTSEELLSDRELGKLYLGIGQ